MYLHFVNFSIIQNMVCAIDVIILMIILEPIMTLNIFFWMPRCTKSKWKTIQLLTYSFSNFSKLNMLCFTKSQFNGIYDFIERKWTLTKMMNRFSVAFYYVRKFRLSYLHDTSTKSFISIFASPFPFLDMLTVPYWQKVDERL